MKHILTPILLLVFLFPTLALGEDITILDLEFRYDDWRWYQKSSDVPFTGKVTGQRQGMLQNGKEEGPWVVYYENGQLESKGNYKNGWKEGPWVVYYENGQLKSKGNYKNGDAEGQWVAYYEDGTVWKAFTGTYKNDKKVD